MVLKKRPGCTFLAGRVNDYGPFNNPTAEDNENLRRILEAFATQTLPEGPTLAAINRVLQEAAPGASLIVDLFDVQNPDLDLYILLDENGVQRWLPYSPGDPVLDAHQLEEIWHRGYPQHKGFLKIYPPGSSVDFPDPSYVLMFSRKLIGPPNCLWGGG